MSIKDAKEKCPSLVLVNGEDLTHYRHMSYKISEYLQQYCAKVERLGFDENFLDVTEQVNDRITNQHGKNHGTLAGHVYGEEPSVIESCSCGCHERLRVGSQLAADIREGLFKELGITCCGGIAHNKLLSKLVAGTHKPNQQTTLFPENTSVLMSSLRSVRNIPGIGHSTGKQLKEMGIESVKDLQDAESVQLKNAFGEAAATTMKQLAIGIDETPVMPFSQPQTLSDEDSFKKCSSIVEVKRKIKELITSLLTRLLEDGRVPATFRLTVRKMSAENKYLNRESRQCPIPSSVFRNFSQDKILQTCDQLELLAFGLFGKMVNTQEPFHLTLINVAFAKMEDKSKNAITNFFSPKSANSQADAKLEVPSSEANEKESKLSTETNKDSAAVETCYSSTGALKKIGPRKFESGRNTLFHWLSSPPKESEIEQDKASTVGQIDSDKCDKLENSKESVTERTNEKHALSSAHKQSEKRKSSSEETLQKRLKLMSDSEDLIPDHIDKTVFYQLPPSIQQEILATKGTIDHVKYPKSASHTVSQLMTLDPNVTRKQGRNMLEEECKAVGPNVVQSNEGEIDKHKPVKLSSGTQNLNAGKSSSTSFFKSKFIKHTGLKSVTEPSHCDSSAKDKMKIFDDNANVGVSVNDLNRLEDLSKRTSAIDDSGSSILGTAYSTEESINIPPDVDRETFLGLPPEIQKEFITEWKRKTNSHAQTTSNKPPHFKMPERSSSNSILSYFPKSNR